MAPGAKVVCAMSELAEQVGFQICSGDGLNPERSAGMEPIPGPGYNVVENQSLLEDGLAQCAE